MQILFFPLSAAFGGSTGEEGAVQKSECHDSILSRGAWRDAFCIPQGWQALPEWLLKQSGWGERAGCQHLQWTYGRDLDLRGRPGNPELGRLRARTWLNQSRTNLWIGSRVVCVTHGRSLLRSVLAWYRLNGFCTFWPFFIWGWFIPSIPRTEGRKRTEGSRRRVLNLWKIYVQAFRHSSSLLIFQEASSPDLAGDAAPVWLRIPAAPPDLPAKDAHSGYTRWPEANCW